MIDKASGYGEDLLITVWRWRVASTLASWSPMTLWRHSLEKLGPAADSNNADFAKANFDFYWSKPEERRSLHEMFRPQDCDKPVHPSDTTEFFKQKPSIWSAVYRRDFLERNGITFLPTASFSGHVIRL